MIPSGIEPATFRLVEQCLNQLRYPQMSYYFQVIHCSVNYLLCSPLFTSCPSSFSPFYFVPLFLFPFLLRVPLPFPLFTSCPSSLSPFYFVSLFLFSFLLRVPLPFPLFTSCPSSLSPFNFVSLFLFLFFIQSFSPFLFSIVHSSVYPSSPSFRTHYP